MCERKVICNEIAAMLRLSPFFFLWGRLDKLKEVLDASGGLIPLPMIKNAKTVDPQDDKSTKVCQVRDL